MNKMTLKEKFQVWYFDNYEGPLSDMSYDIINDTGKPPTKWETFKIKCWLWWDIAKCTCKIRRSK
jgi:hypothetical protein